MLRAKLDRWQTIIETNRNKTADKSATLYNPLLSLETAESPGPISLYEVRNLSERAPRDAKVALASATAASSTASHNTSCTTGWKAGFADRGAISPRRALHEFEKKEQLIMRIDRKLDAQWQERTRRGASGELQSIQLAAMLSCAGSRRRLAAQTEDGSRGSMRI